MKDNLGRNLDAQGFNDRAASVRVLGPPLQWVLRRDYATGPCTTVSQDIADLSIHAVGSRSASYLSMTDCGNTRVELYEAWNYGGRKVIVEKHSGDLSELGFGGIVSSAKLLTPSQPASLYSKPYWQGLCSTIAGEVPQLDLLAVGNDKAVSFSDAPCPFHASAIRLFDEWDHQGRALTLEQHVPDLTEIGFNGALSSVSLLKNKPAALYSGVNYTGRCSTASANIARLNDFAVGNDTTASIRLGATCPGNESAIRLHDAWNFEGRSVVVEQDVPDLGAVGFNGILSSVSLLQNKTAALYSGVNYTGQCSTAFENTASLHDRAVGNDGAMSVRLNARCPLPAETATWPGHFSTMGGLGPYAWIDGPSVLSTSLHHAVVSGVADGVKLYVCRVRTPDGQTHLGKYFNRVCNYPAAGKEVTVANGYELLVNTKPEYERALEKNWMRLPLPTLVYYFVETPSMGVCRGYQQNGGAHPGELRSGKCYFGWGGQEVATSTFDVLVLRFNPAAY